jgi:hypothetical protein
MMEPKHMSWWLCQQCGQWVDDVFHGCKGAATEFAVTNLATGVVTIYHIDAQGNILPETPPLPPLTSLTFPKPKPFKTHETPPKPRHAFVDNTGWRNAWAYCVETRKKSRLFDKEWWVDWELAVWATPYAFKTREACDRRRAEFERAAVHQGTEFRSNPRFFGHDVTTALWYREDWVTIPP